MWNRRLTPLQSEMGDQMWPNFLFLCLFRCLFLLSFFHFESQADQRKRLFYYVPFNFLVTPPPTGVPWAGSKNDVQLPGAWRSNLCSSSHGFRNVAKTSANPWVGNQMMRSYGPGLWIICDGLPMPVGGWVTKKLKGALGTAQYLPWPIWFHLEIKVWSCIRSKGPIQPTRRGPTR